MAKYHLTNKAVQDLNEIWNYTYHRWSEEQADFYYEMLLENCQEIAENPKLGRSYEGVLPALSGHKIAKHIIFYRPAGAEFVEITRILHENMDLPNRMGE